MQTPVDKIRRKFLAFRRILDQNETSTTFLRIFRGMYCFEWLELSATYSLMASMRLEIVYDLILNKNHGNSLSFLLFDWTQLSYVNIGG